MDGINLNFFFIFIFVHENFYMLIIIIKLNLTKFNNEIFSNIVVIMGIEKNNEEKLEKERIEKEALEIEKRELENREKERLEKERLEHLKMESKLYPNYSILIIPSWSDLVGYPTLGTYVNHPVSNIESDIVIFFSGYDYSIESLQGTLHYLFGLGSYFLKFELESGKYVTDKRSLTGLILSDFVYDHMATSANITLEDDRDVIIAEKVVKIPINLSNKSENRLIFIKGALMRNVFIPYKDIFLEIMEEIRKDNSYSISTEGHKVLSAHRDFFNQILVSDKMYNLSINPDHTYNNSTAGLDAINFAADILLEETISPDNLSLIEYNIQNLKSVYSKLEIDPMYLFSIIEQTSSLFSSDMPPTTSKAIDSGLQKPSKHSIYTSAEDRLYSFVSWPVEFRRKAKKEPLISPEVVEPTLTVDKIDFRSSDIETISVQDIKQEDFKLDTLKSESVERKPLPNPPKADMKQIFVYLKTIIEQNYEMPSIGHAFELARESSRQMGVSATTTYQSKIWEMSKYANIYIKKEQGFGLPKKEQEDLLLKINNWILEIEETERLERERLEKIRLEKERLERLERERKERERQEKERKERERIEQIRLEQERAQQAQLEQERLDKIEREKEEALRLERVRLQKEREELEAIEKEKEEVKKLKLERKKKEKEAKQEAKKRKKLEKQKKKLEKKKRKEQEKLKNL